MAWEEKHRVLRDTCAYLWPDPRDCRRLVSESGIILDRIVWDEPPALRWGSVIMEAMKQQTLHKLTPILLKDYPENNELRKAVEPWRYGSHGETGPKKENTVISVVEVSPSAIEELIEKIEELSVIQESMRIDLARYSLQIEELEQFRKALGTMASVPIGPPNRKDRDSKKESR